MTTTTNNLIEQVGGIEKAKAIVIGAPETSTLVFYFFDEINNELIGPEYYRDNGSQHFNKLRQSWGFCLDPQIRVTKPHDSLIGINDLRTAIEHHYYGRSEAEELAAYAELSHEKIEGGAMLVGDFSEARKIIDKQLESDHITDILNHISPNTKVVEL